MATVAIEVYAYKWLYNRALALATFGVGEDIANDLMCDMDGTDPGKHDMPYPDWVCDHCGYANPDGNFEGQPCPRCGKNPIMLETVSIPTTDLLVRYGSLQYKDGMTYQEYWDNHPDSNSRYGVRLALLRADGLIE